MRILLFSTLFPNAAMPAHGVFVANRLDAFLKRHDAEVKVIAPVPWFAFRHKAFGAYGAWARAPEREMRGSVEVLHPRYFIPPKTAMHAAPSALTRCLRKAAGTLIESGWEFDLIDAHYFYPDGVAAAHIARELEKPLVITARGSDVTQLPQFAGPRRAILDAANRADAVVSVAAALKTTLIECGVQGEKITVLRNGVDLERFKPADRAAARRALGVDGLVLASVGHLIDRKGHDRIIRALGELPEATLVIAGEGPERARLAALARKSGVEARVRFLGTVAHDALAQVYSAADLLVLASLREGWPNVLLEAMACGCPCIASDVGGAGEVIRAPAAGTLLADRTPEAIAAAVRRLTAEPTDRSAVRAYAQRHGWAETADGMAQLFGALCEKQERRARVGIAPVRLHEEGYIPRLIVTVDTEEKFDWSDFKNVKHEVGGIDGLQRFQMLCARHGARPLYFLTWPFLQDAAMAAHFRALKAAGVADCGLHLHQWATPPGGFGGEFYSFQKNLPRDVHLEKLSALAGAYEETFGSRARAHRAGRYGIAPEDYELLTRIGIEFDFSPSAGFDFSTRGGPEFSSMSNFPFAAEGEGWRILVTPVSGAKAIRRTRIFTSQETSPPGFFAGGAKLSDRFKLALRLSPEGARLADLKALTRRLIADRTPVLTFTLHSTSLTARGNAYAPDQVHVERLLADSNAYLDWFANKVGGEIVSLDQLSGLYSAETRRGESAG